MGSTATGYDVLPSGAQQMWQNEYYYIDGETTLHQNEGAADYNLIVMLSSWEAPTPTSLPDRHRARSAMAWYATPATTLPPTAVPHPLSTPTDQSKVPQRSLATP